MAENYRQKYKDHYGIDFSSDYVVHHIDMNRENNDMDNLLLLPKKLHAKYHGVLAYCRACKENAGCKKTEITLDFSIAPTDVLGYSVYDIGKLVGIINQCAMWADYKLYLDGKMPNIHGISIKE